MSKNPLLISDFQVTISTSQVGNAFANSASTTTTLTTDSTIVSKGVCWNTSANPTIANSKVLSISGATNFDSDITGLTQLTTYHIRGLCQKSNGAIYYSNDLEITTPDYITGQTAFGGTIYYIDESYYYIAAPNGSQGIWGSESITTNATSDTDGALNTTTILAADSTRPIAASICTAVTYGGYTDWYLPALTELKRFYGKGVNTQTGNHWTSKEKDVNEAWVITFPNYSFDIAQPKSTAGNLFVHPVRKQPK